MPLWRYRFAGLRFESVLHIPEWDAFIDTDALADPDVRIEREPDAPPGLIADEPPGVTSHHYRLSVGGVARFHVHHGRRISVTPAAGVDGRELRLFLLGSALAALCAQRDLLLLHASVVRLSTGRAVALCGPAGAGKSTLAAALIKRGAAFVCDDLSRFDVIVGRAVVYPATARLKLRPEALDALAWPEGFEPVHSRATKRHVPQVHDDPWSPIPLNALYLLEWADADADVSLTSVTGVASLRAVVAAATYRPGLLEPMGQLAAHWRRCAELAARVAVHRLSRPREWSTLDAVAATVEALG